MMILPFLFEGIYHFKAREVEDLIKDLDEKDK